MSTDEYNVDDILLEAQRLREKGKRSTSTAPKAVSQRDFQNAVDTVDNILGERHKEITEKYSVKSKLPNKEHGSKPVESAVETPFTFKADTDVFEAIKEEKVIAPKKTPKEQAEEISSFAFSLDPAEPEKIDPIPPRPAFPEKPIERKVRPKSPVKENQPKLDLFDFQPEQREKPIRTGPFGQKHFDFQKPVSNRPVSTPMKPVDKPKIKTVNPNAADFDFASISDKIDELQKEEVQEQENRSPRKDYNPIDFTASVGSVTEKAKKKQSSYADLATGKRKGFSFAEKMKEKEEAKAKAKEETAALEDVAVAIEEEDGSVTGTVPSATLSGTGRELNIEEIKRINFAAVEGQGSGGFYEEEEDHYASDLPNTSYLNFHEYGPKSDRLDVARDISEVKMKFFIRTILTGLLTFILFYIGLSGKYANIPTPPIFYPVGNTLPKFLILCIVLTVLVGIVNFNTMISGIGSLFRMRANSDTIVSFAVIGAILQGITAYQHQDLLDVEALYLYFPIAALAMLLNSIGKFSIVGRIQQNFKVTASKQKKHALVALDSQDLISDFLPEFTKYKPTIVHDVQADFVTDYMALSFSNKYDVGINRSVAPVCIIGAVVVGIATRFLTADSLTASTAFTAVLCICATFSSNFIENIPLGKMAKKLTPMGAMVSGNKAVESFCDTNAVIMKENDLFPKGHVYLNGIKAFPGARIDESILDAASVLCALEGSLSHVFLEMIGGNKKLLKKVDNVVYENEMGLSGWVDDRRVLIGNRALMQHHGIPLPEDSYEKAHPNFEDAPGNPIYVSNSGEVAARFLVEYVVDEDLAYQLMLLAEKEINLIVYTTDANITAQKIWDAYGYPIDLITIMSSELHDEYREISEPRKETPAEIVYTGRPSSMIAAILGTINARSSILSATVVQLVQIILGYGIVALMAFMGYIGKFSMIQMLMYQVFWFIAIFVVQQLKKP